MRDKRQKTSGYPYPLPPPSVCGIFTTYYYWGYMGVSVSYSLWVLPPVSNGYLYTGGIVVGGIYFFLEFFWESNSRELSKTRNK